MLLPVFTQCSCGHCTNPTLHHHTVYCTPSSSACVQSCVWEAVARDWNGRRSLLADWSTRLVQYSKWPWSNTAWWKEFISMNRITVNAALFTSAVEPLVFICTFWGYLSVIFVKYIRGSLSLTLPNCSPLASQEHSLLFWKIKEAVFAKQRCSAS